MIAANDKRAAARTTTERDSRWAAVVARDRAADGKFFYSVSTTGVYCRPSCAARPARPENVAFHATRADAEQAGLPPVQALQARPAGAGRAARGEGRRGLPADRGRRRSRRASTSWRATVGLSPYHFHRVFKAVTGVTPKAYAAAHRAERVRERADPRAAR